MPPVAPEPAPDTGEPTEAHQRRRWVQRHLRPPPPSTAPRRHRRALWMGANGSVWAGGTVNDAVRAAADALEARIPPTVDRQAALDRVAAGLAGVGVELRAPDTAEGRAAVAALLELIGIEGV